MKRHSSDPIQPYRSGAYGDRRCACGIDAGQCGEVSGGRCDAETGEIELVLAKSEITDQVVAEAGDEGEHVCPRTAVHRVVAGTTSQQIVACA